MYDLEERPREEKILENKGKIAAFAQIIAACLIGATLTGGGIYYNNYKKSGYMVRYEGKFLGYVKNRESALKAIREVKDDIRSYDGSIAVSDDIELMTMLINPEKTTNSEAIRNTIEDDLYKQYTSYVITVNGKEIGALKSRTDAEDIIEKTRKYYENQEKRENVQVVDVNIKDDIEYIERVVNNSKVTDKESILKLLTSSIGETKKCAVKTGDTIWDIAKNNNMSVNDIAKLNPGLNVDKLQIGQNINISVSRPFLNVETVLKVNTDEGIPYNVTYINDSSLYKGQTKVVNSGEYGVNRTVKQLKKFNGKVTESKILSTSTVKDPVARVVAQGTKEKVVVGSGNFSWPTNGHISSGYGYRGGEFHQAVDIAAPYGSAIYASDSGKITYAGWESGYGKLIIINHGNGFVTYYGHCSSINVSVGQAVNRGSRIGSVGMTGDATGPHVHFEVRVNGVRRNPLIYLR
ncbi:MAG: peptidoglycan DD-metalloendopeptidase family protein [Clostridiales bacterium]|nr:peptidoglycan DD-metalloendopeptidase family protein [Clostridiales bacterium]